MEKVPLCPVFSLNSPINHPLRPFFNGEQKGVRYNYSDTAYDANYVMYDEWYVVLCHMTAFACVLNTNKEQRSQEQSVSIVITHKQVANEWKQRTSVFWTQEEKPSVITRKMERLIRPRRRKTYYPRVHPMERYDEQKFRERYRLSKEKVGEIAAEFRVSGMCSTQLGVRGGGLSIADRVSYVQTKLYNYIEFCRLHECGCMTKGEGEGAWIWVHEVLLKCFHPSTLGL